jgi:hypothetical protein
MRASRVELEVEGGGEEEGDGGAAGRTNDAEDGLEAGDGEGDGGGGEEEEDGEEGEAERGYHRGRTRKYDDLFVDFSVILRCGRGGRERVAGLARGEREDDLVERGPARVNLSAGQATGSRPRVSSHL